MKKRFFIPACLLLAAAVVFVMYALGHPELSFPWSVRISHILYGLYVDAVLLLFVLAFWKNSACLNVLTLLFELGAVFFLVQSMLTVFPEGKSNWYLPLALGLNCIALFLNAVQRRKQPGKKEAKEVYFAVITALLLLSLAACGKPQTPDGTAETAAVPPQTEAQTVPETTSANTIASNRVEASEDVPWMAALAEDLFEKYGVLPEYYEDLGDGIYQVYVEVGGEIVPFVTVNSATGDYYG